MGKTKIEWTDFTWNPVWGCKANCEYCYARRIARRFAWQMTKYELDHRGIWDLEMRELLGEEIERYFLNFKPIFLTNNFDNFKPSKNPSRIFVGSMSDIAFWENEWLEKVAGKIKEYPQHTFLLLTKFPRVYEKLDNAMPENVWFGVTVTNQEEVKKINELAENVRDTRVKYVSFEPLLEKVELDLSLFYRFHWAIIGTMSGKKRTLAKFEWVESIVRQAKEENTPVFIKQLEINGKVEKNIRKFPKELQLREFPKINTHESNR